MNIHYFASSTLISDSANSVHVMKMAEALGGLGCDVTLHALMGDGNNAEDVFRYYKIKNRDSLRIIRHDLFSNAINKFLKKLILKLPRLRIGGMPSLIYGYLSLRKQISQKDVDLLFSRNLYWLWAFRKEAPYIYECHSTPDTVLHKVMEKRLFEGKNCRAVVVISEKLKELYVSMFPDLAHKFMVAHDAAEEPEHASACIRATLSRPVRQIGYVGHLYRGRGIEIIVAMAEKMPHHMFHIVGGRADLVEKMSANVSSNIVFHGHQPYEKLSEFYASFDIVIAPYQNNVAVHGNLGDTSGYMSPLKIFEYMSWGLPIICSDMPVLREVLSNNKNSLLVTSDDPTQWIEAVKKIEASDHLRIRLSSSARKDFTEKYSWASRAKAILAETNFLPH